LVYFIQGTITKLIKIGRTDRVVRNPEKLRFKELQAGSPDELVILACVPEWSKKEECVLHRGFAHLRVHGEWFRPEQELLDFLDKPLEAVVEWLSDQSARPLKKGLDPKDLEEKRFKEKLRQLRFRQVRAMLHYQPGNSVRLT